jgi:Smg protein
MDVLQYLYERFQNGELMISDKNQSIVKELKNVGFKLNEIDSALDWLDGLIEASSENFAPAHSSSQHTRIFHPYESRSFTTETKGVLYFLEQIKVITPHSREAIIDRVLALELEQPIDLDGLKWVIHMVLFNFPESNESTLWLEPVDSLIH